MNISDKGYVLMIGNRFFTGFGKAGRIKTAWSLAGATIFLNEEHYLPALDKLMIFARNPVVVSVVLDRTNPL